MLNTYTTTTFLIFNGVVRLSDEGFMTESYVVDVPSNVIVPSDTKMTRAKKKVEDSEAYLKLA